MKINGTCTHLQRVGEEINEVEEEAAFGIWQSQKMAVQERETEQRNGTDQRGSYQSCSIENRDRRCCYVLVNWSCCTSRHSLQQVVTIPAKMMELQERERW